jgi:predicted transglutaminase-like cysteine proteinase
MWTYRDIRDYTDMQGYGNEDVWTYMDMGLRVYEHAVLSD